jgi:hypothetical protein
MILCGVRYPGPSIEEIRSLTADELAANEKYKPIVATARNRFRLFRYFHRSYTDWEKAIQSHLRPGSFGVEEQHELDRLMFNLLTMGRALIDHFRQYYIQTFRHTAKEEDFKTFIALLETQSWAVAFFHDHRNYVQHCGLPITDYSKRMTHNSVVLSIEADAVYLSKVYDKWERSNLNGKQGKIDLIQLCEEYHVRLLQDFGTFIAKAFAHEFADAHNFYASLANEVWKKFPSSKIAIISSKEVRADELDLELIELPHNLLAELGIRHQKAASNQTI